LTRNEDLVVRDPLWQLFNVGAIVVVAIAPAVLLTALFGHLGLWYAIVLVWLVAMATLALGLTRVLRAGVCVGDDTVSVRRLWKSQSIPRAEIRGLTWGFGMFEPRGYLGIALRTGPIVQCPILNDHASFSVRPTWMHQRAKGIRTQLELALGLPPTDQ
jgi:hypothetical protein